nr:MAG TPA: hypothetical protein [Caudoviricetes sp.]
MGIPKKTDGTESRWTSVFPAALLPLCQGLFRVLSDKCCISRHRSALSWFCAFSAPV